MCTRRSFIWQLAFSALTLFAIFVWRESNESNPSGRDVPETTNVRTAQQESGQNAVADAIETPISDLTRVAPAPSAAAKIHPLLEQADEVVLVEGCDEVQSTANTELAALVRAIAGWDWGEGQPAPVAIDYPLNNSIFPPRSFLPRFSGTTRSSRRIRGCLTSLWGATPFTFTSFRRATRLLPARSTPDASPRRTKSISPPPTRLLPGVGHPVSKCGPRSKGARANRRQM